jgi:hypothetical protein
MTINIRRGKKIMVPAFRTKSELTSMERHNNMTAHSLTVSEKNQTQKSTQTQTRQTTLE